MERKERARRVRVQRERMKGWQKVWDACMKAARDGNEQPKTADDEDTRAPMNDEVAAKNGRDEDKNDILPF